MTRRGLVAPQTLCPTTMSSPFAAKLGTNYCPRDAEVTEIKALLVEPTFRWKSLNNEIADMQRIIDKLAEERDALGAYIEAHKALISPLRRMPLDIIQEIFSACIPTHRNCVMSSKEPPVLLGRICSAWRTISLSTPHLWSKLHIIEPTAARDGMTSAFQEKVSQRLETMKAWLGRSGQCALSISFQCALQSHSADNIPPPENIFMQAIVSFASRWEDIEFTVSPSVLAPASQLTEADIPKLKSLRIYHMYERTPRAIQWESLGLLGASALSHVAITTNRFNVLALPLHWIQLRSISISETWNGETSVPPTTSETVLQLLSQCPELRSCRFWIQDDPENHSRAPIHVIEHPLLETFEIECGGDVPSVIHHLFSSLSLPGLRHLKIRGYCDSGTTLSQSPFPIFPATLDTFDINIEAFPRPSLGEVFRGLPDTLRTVRIQDLPPHHSPVDLRADTLTFLPPGLQELEIRVCSSFSDEQLLRFMQSRMTGGASRTLRRLHVAFSRQIEYDILPELRQFMEEGVRVELTYPPHQKMTNFSPWIGLDMDDRPEDS
ncbi:hypothetical protein DFH07DRAFT_847384 [Mycena maculata]|uniref:F-box domain-containing protein n=1 Tax=Mycena maculata TaxID=230809 RepID=A0AAD7HYZ6_9AGAR|nr:hypothetical protein DFH07DRAFT_847384 [Mycena maculata]